jgi:glycosyltransferase involved in cell wall biosynthesis
VGSGIKVDGDIDDPTVKKQYLEALLDLMGNEDKWRKEQEKGIEFAKNYDWSEIAKRWTDVFVPDAQSIKVSIVTPTNRRGFWNIMAHNISSQTYKNLEWVIVDDYKENREHIAKEYSRKYKIDIKYYRGKPRKVKRHFGLVNANNTGLFVARGELLLILQDFILMPLDGVEQLVILHKNNPNALLAPVDEYFAPKVKPDTESEDWFHGELDVKGEFMRTNARVLNQGVRESTNPFEFEQNYCAVPKAIAQDLGGWYEFFDEGLGFDNTEFAFRAITAGYKLIVDDTNICTCIDHWNALEGTVEHGLGRERRLSDPRYIWEMQMIEDGKLPLRRTQEIDDKIELLYEMPAEVPTEDAVKWMRENTESIVTKWIEEVKFE